MDNMKITKPMMTPANSSDEASVPASIDTPKNAIKLAAKTPSAKKVLSASTQASTKKTAAKNSADKIVQTTQDAKVGEPAVKASAAKKSVKKSPAALKAEHPAKLKKERLVRDSFTMPESEYQVLADAKKECLQAGFTIKKTELLRVSLAGLKLLSVDQLIAARDSLTKVATGRPKK